MTKENGGALVQFVPRPSRTAQLEERLNGLVDLLRASTEYPAEETSRSRQHSAHADDGSFTSSQGPSPGTSGTDGGTIHVPPSWNSSCPPRCVCGQSTPGEVPIDGATDEDVLALYRSQLMPVFPFVLIRPGTRAQQLRAERPLLFAAVRMAASFAHVRSMRAQMYQLVRRLAQEILVSSVRSLDLLQALLVTLGWFQNHCIVHAQLNSLLHLAQAQLADLGLNREPEIQERTSVVVLHPGAPPPRGSDEKRATLGVWFLSSVISTALFKTYSTKFSKYHKQCLRDLDASPEYETDPVLVHLIKIQRLTDQIQNWVSRDEEEDVPGMPRAPMSAYQSAFEVEMQRLQHSLPPALKDNKLLQVYHASTTLRLHQPPPVEAAVLKGLADSLTTITPGVPSTIDTFHRARSALEGFFDSFMALPTESWTVMPLFTILQGLWSVTMLARWAKVMGPGRPSSAAPDILATQKVIWDPSVSRRNAAPPRAAGPRLPPAVTDPAQIPAAQLREAADPAVPRAAAALRAALRAQPGLRLDVVGVLAALARRFDEAHRRLRPAAGDGPWQGDFWYLGGKKVLIARAKLERWAGILEAGGVSRPAGGRRDGDVPMGDGPGPAVDGDHGEQGEEAAAAGAAQGRQSAHHHQNYHPHLEGETTAAFQREMETAAQGIWPPDSMSQYDAGMYGGVWTDSMFDPLDPSLWLNDGSDWSMALFAGGPTSEDMQTGF